jgi:hypothetical protein
MTDDHRKLHKKIVAKAEFEFQLWITNFMCGQMSATVRWVSDGFTWS